MTTETWRVVDGLGGVREVLVRVEGELLLVGPGPVPRWYGCAEPPRLALMHYALTMHWPLAEILAPGESSRAEIAAAVTRADAAEAECARLRVELEATERARQAAEEERDAVLELVADDVVRAARERDERDAHRLAALVVARVALADAEAECARLRGELDAVREAP